MKKVNLRAKPKGKVRLPLYILCSKCQSTLFFSTLKLVPIAENPGNMLYPGRNMEFCKCSRLQIYILPGIAWAYGMGGTYLFCRIVHSNQDSRLVVAIPEASVPLIADYIRI